MPEATVMTAADGIDATAKLASFMPNLILTDIIMPNMNGAEFVKYIRGTRRYAKTKVIAITGLHKEDSRVHDITAAGIEKMVYKPYDDDEMVSSIRETYESTDVR
ncbi:MAG: response regulator, partial [Deltaproteobacteria bacterium]|nr:response regulator [Deltaproteobacteria bacterium]